VFSDGAALAAGLAAGDIVIAVDYVAVNAESFTKELIRRQAEDSITVHYFRLGELHVTTLTMQPQPLDTAVLTVADKDQFAAWVGVSASS